MERIKDAAADFLAKQAGGGHRRVPEPGWARQ
jgi:hypothetical protein